MANITFHDPPLATLLDGTEDAPLWQSGAAVRTPTAALKRLRINPSPVTAAGSDQSGATVLSNSFDYHVITSATSAGMGVKFATLGATQVGEPRLIRCAPSIAYDVKLYPVSGGKLDDVLNGYVVIPVGRSLFLYAVSTTDWVSVNFAEACSVSTVSAAGSTQTDATVIGSGLTRVTTVGAGQGTKFDVTLQPGDHAYVRNAGANDLKQWPASGGTLGNAATNGSYTIPVGEMAHFIFYTTLSAEIVGTGG